MRTHPLLLFLRRECRPAFRPHPPTWNRCHPWKFRFREPRHPFFCTADCRFHPHSTACRFHPSNTDCRFHPHSTAFPWNPDNTPLPLRLHNKESRWRQYNMPLHFHPNNTACRSRQCNMPLRFHPNNTVCRRHPDNMPHRLHQDSTDCRFHPHTLDLRTDKRVQNTLRHRFRPHSTDCRFHPSSTPFHWRRYSMSRHFRPDKRNSDRNKSDCRFRPYKNTPRNFPRQHNRTVPDCPFPLPDKHTKRPRIPARCKSPFHQRPEAVRRIRTPIVRPIPVRLRVLPKTKRTLFPILP